MQAVRDIAPYAALVAVALTLLLLGLVITLWVNVRRLRRAQTVVLGHHEQRDIVQHVEGLDSQVRNMREAVETLTGEFDGHRARLNDTITNHAVVRYDAFRDTGGEQSASLALLDSHRSGIVLSTIAARDFARVYVKWLQNGVPDRDLSPEERQAVSEAVPQPHPAGRDDRRVAGLYGGATGDVVRSAPTADENVPPPTEQPADDEATTATDPGTSRRPAFESLADDFDWDAGDDRRSS